VTLSKGGARESLRESVSARERDYGNNNAWGLLFCEGARDSVRLCETSMCESAGLCEKSVRSLRVYLADLTAESRFLGEEAGFQLRGL
jgi:hypothetical protein